MLSCCFFSLSQPQPQPSSLLFLSHVSTEVIYHLLCHTGTCHFHTFSSLFCIGERELSFSDRCSIHAFKSHVIRFPISSTLNEFFQDIYIINASSNAIKKAEAGMWEEHKSLCHRLLSSAASVSLSSLFSQELEPESATRHIFLISLFIYFLHAASLLSSLSLLSIFRCLAMVLLFCLTCLPHAYETFHLFPFLDSRPISQTAGTPPHYQPSEEETPWGLSHWTAESRRSRHVFIVIVLEKQYTGVLREV